MGAGPLAGRLLRLWRAERPFLITNGLLCAGLILAGYGWLYPTLWLVPMLTWYQLASRVRNIAEHAVVGPADDPLRNTRTTRANWLERALWAPYWVNYHLEHHLFIFAPCWRLPSAHRLLGELALWPKMELADGYGQVLRLACSRPTDDTAPPGGRKSSRVQAI